MFTQPLISLFRYNHFFITNFYVLGGIETFNVLVLD